MTCRRASSARSFRTSFVATLAIALLATTATFVAAQSAPSQDPSYNIVWEPAPGLTGAPGAYVGSNGAQAIKAYFPETGMRLVPEKDPSSWAVSFALTGYGHPGAIQSLPAATLSINGNRVDFTRVSSLSEWYVNDPAGVQQWLSLSAPPPDPLGEGGPVSFNLALATGLTARLSGGSTILDLSDLDGNVVAQYNAWQVTSAAGKSVQTELQLVADEQGAVTGLTITVSAAADDYPLTVVMAAGSPKTLNLPPPTDSVSVNAVETPLAPSVAPSNDQCAGAEVVPSAGPFPYLTAVTADITDATTTGDPALPSCQSNVSRSIWYRFTPTLTASYTISSCADAPTASTLDDTVIAIYTSSTSACGGTYTQLAGTAGCDDDSCSSEALQSVISNTVLTAGTTYFILVHKYDVPAPTAGNTAVQLRITQAIPPANDSCAGALPLTLNQIATGSNAVATNDYSITSPAAACFPGTGQTVSTAVGRDSVWSFTPATNGKYSFKAQVVDALAGGNIVLYDTTTCPAPGAFACSAALVASNRNTNAGQFTAAEEIMCQTLSAGTTYYLFVDESAATTTGGGYTVEVSPCVQETEPNDTPATANTYGFANTCPIEGSITPANNFDYFSIGTPAAGSRIFATEDGVSGNSTDQRLRITTATDTNEFDDDDNTTPWGSLSSNIAGRPLTGAASYIQVSPFSTTTAQEPYRLYAVVQAPGGDIYGSSATAEVNDATNNTLPGANAAGNMFFSGTMSSTTDLDAYRFCAAAGDVITLGIDADPLRNLTPINPAVFLFDTTGAQLLGFNDADSTSSNTSGAGTLTATTPNSPGESATWRARYTGVYYAGINPQSTTLGDYLYSIGVNCQTGAQQSVDLGVTKTDSPDPVTAGGLLTYSVTVTNAGPNIALDANLLDPLPAGTTYVSLTGAGTGGGWSCTVPVVGTNGPISCTNSCFVNGGSFTFTITVKTASCTGNTSLTNTATVSSLTADSNASNNVATSSTTVLDPGTCDDGDACTTGDTCIGTVCQGGPPPTCDDNDACTSNTCNPSTGLCENPPITCNDGNACTDDTCAPSTGCVYTPNDANPCSDGFLCTTADHCSAGSCVGTAVDCNDGEVCSTDSCDPATGLCVHTPNTNSCDDGNPCTTADTCAPRYAENFDGVTAPALPAGWTSTTTGSGSAWITQSTSSDSAPNSVFAVDGAGPVAADEVLNGTPITIASAAAKLTFRNRWSFESATSCFDAGVLEIKIGAGAFTDIVAAGGSFASGGYTGTVSSSFSNPLAGRSAWCNISPGYPAYLTTVVNLPAAAAGQTIQLRWRVGSDISIAGIGQNIDSIVVTDPSNVCIGGPPLVCNDNNPCTDDSCDPSVGCVFTNNTSPCGDPSDTDCDNPDSCFNGACVPNNEPPGHACSDGNACTQDICLSGGVCGCPIVAGVCQGSAATTFTSTDVPKTIPTTVATVTSTLSVAGADPYLYDVNIKTFITHTFNGDLQMTLKSPAGTIVTLTSGNAGSVDNVFNGTVWDDDADPGSQVPYTTPLATSNLVTDTAYTNLVVKPTLAPEEPLGAFIGQNPNGVWTLTIADTASGDGGSLANWSLALTTLAAAPAPATVSYPSADVPKTIPTSAPPTVVTSSVLVSGAGTQIGQVRLKDFILHTFPGDLDITIQSPAGTIVTLTTDNGSTSDNVFNGTMWDDKADPGNQVPYVVPFAASNLATDAVYVNNVVKPTLTAEEGLAAFNGENPNGVWTLTISDDANLDGGSLTGWTLEVTTTTCQVSVCAVSCNDNNPCTDDSCDPATGCVFTNNANPCNDGFACTTGDTCSGGSCAGTQIVCNDGNGCTNDSCNPATGLCVYVNNTDACNDGNTCTTNDVCAGPATCGATENFDGVTAPALPAGWTTTTTGSGSVWATQSTSSDSAPNSAFAADGAGPLPADEVLDSPPIAITSASATLTFKNRWSFENATTCFDAGVLEIKIGAGAFTDIVTAGGSFITGGYTGTVSSSFSSPLAGRSAWCNTSSGYPAYVTTIVSLPAAAAGQTIQLRWRVGSDVSIAGIGQNIDTIVVGDTCPATCTGGAALDCNDNNPCTDDSCDPATGCVHTDNTSPCNDGNACTTNDTCGGGSCHGGAPPVCDDGNVCTTDTCDPATGCVFTNNTNPCNDGNACTTNDTCGGGTCNGGPPPVCDDGNVCTTDTCAPATGCVFTNNTVPCSDGNACTTGDTCGGGVCNPGGPTNCDDGQCCTIDSCDPATGCVHTANTAPPVFTSQPSLGTCPVLWPPNHKVANFTVAGTGAAATSACGIASIQFASCTSSQPENGTGVGDGNSVRDCVYEPGTLHLRAERDGACSPVGRVYTTQLVATDVCGNTTTSNPLEVAVWHDRGHQPTGTIYSGSGTQNDVPAGTGGTYGPGCGPGSACANGTVADSSDEDPEMEISQTASISVSDLRIEKASGGNVKLVWTDPSHVAGINVTRFHVYRLDPVTLDWTQIAEVTKQTLSYLDPVLNDGVNHQYKVTAMIK